VGISAFTTLSIVAAVIIDIVGGRACTLPPLIEGTFTVVVMVLNLCATSSVKLVHDMPGSQTGHLRRAFAIFIPFSWFAVLAAAGCTWNYYRGERLAELIKDIYLQNEIRRTRTLPLYAPKLSMSEKPIITLPVPPLSARPSFDSDATRVEQPRPAHTRQGSQDPFARTIDEAFSRNNRPLPPRESNWFRVSAARVRPTV